MTKFNFGSSKVCQNEYAAALLFKKYCKSHFIFQIRFLCVKYIYVCI